MASNLSASIRNLLLNPLRRVWRPSGNAAPTNVTPPEIYGLAAPTNVTPPELYKKAIT